MERKEKNLETGMAKGHPRKRKREYLDEVVSWYTRALAEEPCNAQFYFRRGNAYAEKKGSSLRKAVCDYNRALALGLYLPEVYYNIGYTYNLLGEFDKAVDSLTKAIELDPTRASLYFHRGYAYGKQHCPVMALSDFDQAEKLGFCSSAMYVQYGGAYGNLHKYDEAIFYFTKAIELNSRCINISIVAYTYRGLAYYLQEKITEAISDSIKALELCPANETAGGVLDRILKSPKEDIFNSIKQLPLEKAMHLLAQALQAETPLGKRTREKEGFFELVKDLYSATESVKVKRAANIVSQITRDPQNAFFRLPDELGVKIAILAADTHTLNPEAVFKIACENYGRPQLKK